MKRLYLMLAAIIVMSLSDPAAAVCRPPAGANTTWCQSCGNLEQNVSRGHDLAWNELRRNERMQLELSVFGATTVYLTDPPHASPGVLYYTVVIEDPQFAITNSETYAHAVAMMRHYSVGVSFQVDIPELDFTWTYDLSEQIEHAVSASVSTGSAPYTMRMFDSRGNVVDGGTISQPRNTPQQALALVGPNDLNPDNQYRNQACESEDPRSNNDPGYDQADDDPYDYYGYLDDIDEFMMWWEWEEAWGGASIHCEADYSDPAGSGVVCFIH